MVVVVIIVVCFKLCLFMSFLVFEVLLLLIIFSVINDFFCLGCFIIKVMFINFFMVLGLVIGIKMCFCFLFLLFFIRFFWVIILCVVCFVIIEFII